MTKTRPDMSLEEAVLGAVNDRLDVVIRRILSRLIETNDGCWEWQGSRLPTGYGQIKSGRKNKRVHRLMYEFFVEPIQDGLILRHDCDNPPCCNPSHLQVGTHADNRRDCARRGRANNHNTFKTHCDSGHEFTERNTYLSPEGWRTCRECHRLREAARRIEGRKES